MDEYETHISPEGKDILSSSKESEIRKKAQKINRGKEIMLNEFAESKFPHKCPRCGFRFGD